MLDQLEAARTTALAEVQSASDEAAVDAIRVKYLGKTGIVSRVSETMRTLSKEERPAVGKMLNEVRAALTAAIEQRLSSIQAAKTAEAYAKVDVTLPGSRLPKGSLHPVTQLQDRAIQILRRMGFALAAGPDMEDEWHCFDALNTPPDHPARNDQDTFYFPDGRLLRSHTSTVQIRVMEQVEPPIRIIAPGCCYRRDETDATHLPQFTQIEGLYVDKGVTLADLRDTVTLFLQMLFGADTQVRLRPHFFPFTEPSYEIDIKSPAVHGGRKWLELAGCGMVDPAVFDQVNRARGDSAYDSEKWSGFAFGFGLERLAMNLSGVPDIRHFIENDVRFLEQYPI
jgi:phenylalanyl-tRNA synthetase alpha chain